MTEPLNEIRIALVLYGGVSLAIYENGVVRCFHDFVRKKGIFSLLLEMLDADATVDVVAGTSAGGINGLMLGAALENGSNFADTADLWREHGDFGRLLRDVRKADEAVSLLDGENYYQDKLVEAFKKLCEQPDPKYESPGEMDIFITGTDLDGRILSYWDELNQEIRDKSHRTVFHLKHRPGRKWLGLSTNKKADEDVATQAWILASIARITGTFPVAFPPFQLGQIDSEFRATVQEALAGCAARKEDLDENNSFIDGGVLDNKPFGHAIRAIFYRMPTRIVRRHLFYVEPDPDPFRVEKPDPKKHTPFRIATSAMTTIPSHESIYGDLGQLKKHNERIAWINHLTLQIIHDPNITPVVDESLYRTTRIESLARALLLEGDIVPSAEEQIADKKRIKLMEPVRKGLYDLTDQNLNKLDALDTDFHLRLLFRMLYEYSNDLKNEGQITPNARTAMRLLGRIIKSLKLVRDLQIRFREATIKDSIDEAKGDAQQAVQVIYQKFRSFLDAEAEHWSDLVSCLNQPFDKETFENQEKALVPSRVLSQTLKAVNQCIENGTETRKQAPYSLTILERLAEKTLEIIDSTDGGPARLERVTATDKLLYPIQFSAGIHELDRIRLTRVSPRDAQKGLSSGSLNSKVTGEDFAHFSAFLRRDWRSNDILRGRLDAICQSFRALIDHNAMTRLRKLPGQYDHLFTKDRLKAALPHCPDEYIIKVEDAWNNLQTLWFQTATSPMEKKAELTREEDNFVETLIEAAQYDAFMEDVPRVSKDVVYQETICGKSKSHKEVDSDTVEIHIEQLAEITAQQHIAAGNKKTLWNWFNGIGSQTVIGQNGAVPYHILGEYITRAYLLLYGMLGQSLGKKRSFLKGKVGLIFRTPVRLLHEIIYMMRRQTQTAALSVAAIISVALGVFFISVYNKSPVWIAAAFFILVFALLLRYLTPNTKKRKIWKVLIIATVSTCVTWGITHGILYVIDIIWRKIMP